MKPEEFWDLTRVELSQMAMGAISRAYDRREEQGDLIAHLMRPHLKRPFNVRAYVGRPKKKQSVSESEIERREREIKFRRLMEKIEKKEKRNAA